MTTRYDSARWAATEAPAIPAPMTMTSAVFPDTGSVKPGAVALGGHAFALFGVGADLLGNDAAERWPFATRHMLFRVPQIGADQRLAAVEIHLVGADQDAAARHLAVNRAGFEQRWVRGDLGASVHSQRLVDP